MKVNVACVLQSFLKAPSWRPKWKYYHFSLSCVGSVLCLFLMVMVGLELLFIVLVLALSLYKYIAYKGNFSEISQKFLKNFQAPKKSGVTE